ncbi:MAG: lytic transglycosylase domain-containing protein [Acidobacteriaceae bacterium]
MLNRLRKFGLASAIAFLMAGCLLPLHAADRVYLRNGSDLVCDHQANLSGQVRLYLTATGDNYLDVAANDIVRQEVIAPEPVQVAGLPAAMPATSMSAAAAVTPVPTQAELSALLDRAGAEHHLDPDLLASVIRAESGGNAHVVSRTGARGLMQLMPGTARDLGVENSFVAEQNVAGGTTYLDALLMYYHDNLALALAAYNAGPAAVNRYRGIPPYAETRRYVASVIHDYNQRKLKQARQQHLHRASRAEMAAVIARP